MTANAGYECAARLQLTLAEGSLASPRRQFVPKMDADNGKQGQNTHIGMQTRQRAAVFVGETGQRRMNSGRIMWGWHGWPKTIASNAQAPPSTERGPGSNVVLTAFLA
jgi:hypothetical protein